MSAAECLTGAAGSHLLRPEVEPNGICTGQPDHRLALRYSVRGRSVWISFRFLQPPYGGDLFGEALLSALEACPVLLQSTAGVGQSFVLSRLKFRKAGDLALEVLDLLGTKRCRCAPRCGRSAEAALLIQLGAGEVEELGAGDVFHAPVPDAGEERDLGEVRDGR
ncbi:hypothetical protein ACWDUC_30935 [Streptomyces tricolor]